MQMSMQMSKPTPHNLVDWMPNNMLPSAVPLTEKYECDKYILHYYDGFNPDLAMRVCDETLQNVILLWPINIYLYIIDYPHDHTTLDRKGSNNGYTQRVGDRYSIVIFRKLFWPKVLLHELLHVLWFQNNLPMIDCSLKWDEAIIEAYAVRSAVAKNYINGTEYFYYLKQSQNTILQVCGGDISVLRSQQKTPLFEYIFLSDKINNLLQSRASTPSASSTSSSSLF